MRLNAPTIVFLLAAVPPAFFPAVSFAEDANTDPAAAFLADPANAGRVEALRADARKCLAAGPALDAEALARLEAASGVPFGVFESLVREAPGGSETRTGFFRVPFTVPADGKETHAEVYVPEGYDPSRKWPLMVSMHGHGCVGDMQRGWYAPWAERIGFLLCAPQGHTEFAGTGWASTEPERSNPVAAVEAMKRLYNVDPDRVILGGCCMGGHGTWEVAMLYADRFCAAFPTIGGPRIVNFAYAENLRNLPFFTYVGLKDQEMLVKNNHWAAELATKAGGEVRMRDFPDLGHVVVREEDGPFFEWWNGRPRNVYPKKVVWRACKPEHRRAYWVEIESFLGEPFDPYVKKEVRLAPGQKADDEGLRQAYVRMIREKTPGITADIRPGNRIEATARGLDKVSFYLSDRLLDLDKTVAIVVNGKTRFSGVPKRSLRLLLGHAAETNDTGRVFAA
ncbi:MAG: dienelactone hydrolase family protein, partial [Planctomycetes bacterium]|nr:dienelactone hydrolase family protein [Planctomycetota bacterium]